MILPARAELLCARFELPLERERVCDRMSAVRKTKANADALSGIVRRLAYCLVGAVWAITLATVLTLVAALYVCLGLHPETMTAVEIIAPLLGLLSGGIWVGRRTQSRPWLAGGGVALITVLAWFVTYLYLTCRWDAHAWVRQPLPSLCTTILPWYVLAIAAGAVGGVIGARLPKASRLWMITPVIVAVVMVMATFTLPAAIRWGGVAEIADGATLRCERPDREGTTLRLLSFDLLANPSLRIGLYDTDSDDLTPYDDVNTTYLGTPLEPVLRKLRHRNVVCAVNAGFFGWDRRFVGMHVAPVVANGRPLYNVGGPHPEWWTFGITGRGPTTRFHLDQGLTWKDLFRFDTAVVHVRPLIVAGKPLVLGPGAGVTGLRCSRMSIAWTADSRRFYVLMVRDPDGEMSSVRQMKSRSRQTGGWDLHQVQRFWHRMGVQYAIALDGGDSTQLAYRDPRGRFVLARSGYQASLTLAHLRGRPLRLFVPMLPPEQDHNGVMNYLYVSSAQ